MTYSIFSASILSFFMPVDGVYSSTSASSKSSSSSSSSSSTLAPRKGILPLVRCFLYCSVELIGGDFLPLSLAQVLIVLCELE